MDAPRELAERCSCKADLYLQCVRVIEINKVCKTPLLEDIVSSSIMFIISIIHEYCLSFYPTLPRSDQPKLSLVIFVISPMISVNLANPFWLLTLWSLCIGSRSCDHHYLQGPIISWSTNNGISIRSFTSVFDLISQFYPVQAKYMPADASQKYFFLSLNSTLKRPSLNEPRKVGALKFAKTYARCFWPSANLMKKQALVIDRFNLNSTIRE